jgi:hypothetical protein
MSESTQDSSQDSLNYENSTQTTNIWLKTKWTLNKTADGERLKVFHLKVVVVGVWKYSAWVLSLEKAWKKSARHFHERKENEWMLYLDEKKKILAPIMRRSISREKVLHRNFLFWMICCVYTTMCEWTSDCPCYK